MEGDKGVAADGVGKRERRCVGALVVSDAVDPGQGVADFMDIRVSSGVTDGQAQRDDTVATRCVEDDEGWRIGAFGVGDTIDPGQRIADILNIGVIG